MTFTSLLMVVLAAMAHAMWNLLAKSAATVGPAFVFAYGLCSTILYAPWVIWVLVSDGMDWNGPVIACLLVSSLLNLGYSLCLQRGYQVADLSVVYPIARGTGPLLSTTGAFVLLNEPSHPKRYCRHVVRRNRCATHRDARKIDYFSSKTSVDRGSLGSPDRTIHHRVYRR
jgi:multidrug transporter EmrE-like cation transporter